MNREEALKQVLSAYGLTREMPAAARAAMRRAQGDTLARVLKKHGKYSLTISLALGLHVWLKKIGISITLAKSAFIVSAAAVTGAVLITGTAAYTVHHVITTRRAAEVRLMPRGETDPAPAKSISRPAALPRFALGIMPFEYGPSISREGARANLKVAEIALRVKGAGHAAFMADPSAFERPRLALTGSVVKLGSLYRITVRLVDNASSKVVFFTSENAAGEDDIGRACEDLMGRIAGAM